MTFGADFVLDYSRLECPDIGNCHECIRNVLLPNEDFLELINSQKEGKETARPRKTTEKKESKKKLSLISWLVCPYRNKA